MSEAAHPSSGSTAATSSTSSELELIEQLKRQLAGPLFAAVSDQFSHLQNTVLSYQNKLQYAELKIRVLEERLRLAMLIPEAGRDDTTLCSRDAEALRSGALPHERSAPKTARRGYTFR